MRCGSRKADSAELVQVISIHTPFMQARAELGAEYEKPTRKREEEEQLLRDFVATALLHEVRQIPEITKVISKTELVKLCSVEQHFNHIDETLASWKRRRISRPGNESAPHNSPTVI
jgi:hypothetical protein